MKSREVASLFEKRVSIRVIVVVGFLDSIACHAINLFQNFLEDGVIMNQVLNHISISEAGQIVITFLEGTEVDL